MKPPLTLSSKNLSPPTLPPHSNFTTPFPSQSSHLFHKNRIFTSFSSSKLRHFATLSCTNSSIRSKNNNLNPILLHDENIPTQQEDPTNQWQSVQTNNPNVPTFVTSLSSKFSLSDQAFFLLAFIAFTVSAAFVSLVAAAVPTLHAMGRAANSLAKLLDTTREELPGTVAAIRLSGMEMSDLTLELSDLSQEISEGINKSAQVVKAAEVGIRHIGARAREQTVAIIQENANLSPISLQPVVSSAAKKTSHAFNYARRRFMNLFSGEEVNSEEAR